VAGGIYFFASRPKATPATPKTPYVWNFDMDHLQYIQISLPNMESTATKPNTQAWLKHEDRYFYFNVPNGSMVDNARWGGGIPLILSGPAAARIIAQGIPESEQAEYGFATPNMDIVLKLDDGSTYNIILGNATPSATGYYIKLAGATDIYTVDSSWYDVVARLITEPPYPPATFATGEISVTPAQPAVGQDISISIEETNTGGVPGEHDVNLKVNAIIEQTQTISLLPKEKRVVTFTLRKSTPGTYSISIDGKTYKLVIQ
jgi:hypothetical protein